MAELIPDVEWGLCGVEAALHEAKPPITVVFGD